MFKVSDDLDFDDDFLGKEFSDDILNSCTPDPGHSENSKSFSAKSSSVDLAVAGVPRRTCSNPDMTPTSTSCNDKAFKSSPLVTQGFQPKTKISPVLLNSADESSTYSRKTPPEIPTTHHPSSTKPQQGLTSRDSQILSKNGFRNPADVPYSNVLTSSHSLPLSATRYNSVEHRNLAFLAEWNDDCFFDAPQRKQPVPSPAVHNPAAEVITRKMNRSVRQRRFPGPAGLLPPRQGNTSLIAPEEFLNELTDDGDPTYKETEILSQSSGSVFEAGAWSAMLEDLGTSGQSLLTSMNLASIKAIGRNLRSYKVPFLSVLVQSIDASLPDAAVVFKDPTGEMHGVIHRDVWDQFSSDIAVGTVLVLRNVGIISAGNTSGRKHVVNITGNNLTAIYSPKDELNIQLRRIHELAASTSSELLAEWEKVESRIARSVSPLSRRVSVLPRSSLFTDFHGGGLTSGDIAGNAYPRPLSHPNYSCGSSVSRPMSPSCSSTNRHVTPCFNQRMAPNSMPRSLTANFNPKNGPAVPNFSKRDGSIAPSLNQRTSPKTSWNFKTKGTVDSSFQSGHSAPGPHYETSDQNASRKSTTTAPSPSSPFSPMLSRQHSWSSNQSSPFENNENSSLTGNQKFVPKSPFTLKAPSSSRPSPRPPINIPNPQTHYSPLTTKAPSSHPSILPVKKPKLSHAVTSSATDCQASAVLKKAPFQLDADTSAVDSLLEGIDTDSLFGDF